MTINPLNIILPKALNAVNAISQNPEDNAPRVAFV